MKLTAYLFICLICSIIKVHAQDDTSVINTLVSYTGRLDTDKTDSIWYYALKIEAASVKINYPYGITASSRLKGRYYQYKENFDSAIIYFHEYSKKAEQYLSGNQQMNAISDIAGVYMMTEQYELAKQNYFVYMALANKIPTSQQNRSQVLNNIAGTYQYLLNNDSAFYYYNKAIQIDESLKDSVQLAERKSNISEVLIPMGKLELARKYLLESTAYNERNEMTDALWYNYSNLGYVYLKLKDYKRSEYYYNLAYNQAQKTSTKTKIVQTLDGFSKLHQEIGDYQKALQYKLQADSINSLLLNENTNKKIAELQEKYQSKKREQANIVLAAQLDKELLQKRNLAIIALSLLIIAGIVVNAYYVNNNKKKLLQKQNNLINEQKDKLSELNLEKNSLISVVSHDLSAPIVNIQLWSKLLRGKIDNTNSSQMKALDHIQESADYGIGLIQNILNVEKVETGHHKIQLEEVQLLPYIDEIKNSFTQASEKKQIQIHVEVEPPNGTLLTDKILLKRMLENLISNALKFSNPNKNVWIKVLQDPHSTIFSVKDEGPGISKEDQQRLFGKYIKLGNRTTGNESSTGLGLHIVDRIIKELNGKIMIDSIVGEGATFKVIFETKK